jgi:hypothetical protein
MFAATEERGLSFNIVTHLSKELPGNGSVNTVQQAAIEQRAYATLF